MTPRSAAWRSRHCGRQRGHAVEHQPAEAGVVLGEVVERRRRRRAPAGRSRRGAQSKSLGHSTLNEKSTADSERVEDVGRREIGVASVTMREPVGGEVAALRCAQHDRAAPPSRARVRRDVAELGALAARDPEVRVGQAREVRRQQRVDEEHLEPALPEQPIALRDRQRRVLRRLGGVELGRIEVADLEEVDPVQVRARARAPPGGRRCSRGSAGPPSSPRDRRGARLAGAPDDVAHLEPERGVVVLDLDVGHLDEVAEPLLQAAPARRDGAPPRARRCWARRRAAARRCRRSGG